MWNYLIVGAVLLARLIAGSDQEYDIGIGIGDITGPAAEIGMVRRLTDSIVLMFVEGYV
ncbi:hypothetical protein IscW_ISCW005516 [Ixodes scapularis]|uniref:Secreted protein n=1 Tax=Ixodes scapularis TaxID=6945 RepID=B7PM33_IXOSC|nr:hypothetical protein IscW_ISCW005516 [Ixodes scapularis]|eukprot:XP_002434831.1 hypothetical protein IscW_ISCW005516 [Ixodes scapularis]